MRQISSLKKQYRDDLETLTKSYEARRKALKEALLLLASPLDNSLSNMEKSDNDLYSKVGKKKASGNDFKY